MCDGPHNSGEHQKIACSGKCRGSCHMAVPRFHVAAASHGLVCLFELCGKELIQHPSPSNGKAFIPEDIAQYLRTQKDGQQLILIGSPTDLAWLHASIPQDTNWNIAAEIPYPLLPAWLAEPEYPQLIQTLRQLLL